MPASFPAARVLSPRSLFDYTRVDVSDDALDEKRLRDAVLPRLRNPGKDAAQPEQRVTRILSNKRITELYVSWMPWQQSALLAGILDRCPADQLTMIYKAVGRGPSSGCSQEPLFQAPDSPVMSREAQQRRAKRLQRELSRAIDAVFHHRKLWKKRYMQRRRDKVLSAAERSCAARTDMYHYVDPSRFSSEIEKALCNILIRAGLSFEHTGAADSVVAADAVHVPLFALTETVTLTYEERSQAADAAKPRETGQSLSDAEACKLKSQTDHIAVENDESSASSSYVEHPATPHSATPAAEHRHSADVHAAGLRGAAAIDEQPAAIDNRRGQSSPTGHRGSISSSDGSGHDPVMGRFSADIMTALMKRGRLMSDEKIAEVVAETLLATAADLGLYNSHSDELSLSGGRARLLKERLSGEVVSAVLRHHHILLPQQHDPGSSLSFAEAPAVTRQADEAAPQPRRRRWPAASDVRSQRVAQQRTRKHQVQSLSRVPPSTPEPSFSTVVSSKRSATTLDYFPERPLQKYGGLCRGVASASEGSSVDLAIPLQSAYKSVKFSYGINEEFLVKPNRKKLAAVYHSQLQEIWQAVEAWRPSDIVVLLVDLVKASSEDALSALRALLSSKWRAVKNINDLPDRLLLRIFSHLGPGDLEIAQEVCQKWHYLCCRPEVWSQKCDELGLALGLHHVSQLLRVEACEEERAIDWKLCYYELEHLLLSSRTAARASQGGAAALSRARLKMWSSNPAEDSKDQSAAMAPGLQPELAGQSKKESNMTTTEPGTAHPKTRGVRLKLKPIQVLSSSRPSELAARRSTNASRQVQTSEPVPASVTGNDVADGQVEHLLVSMSRIASASPGIQPCDGTATEAARPATIAPLAPRADIDAGKDSATMRSCLAPNDVHVLPVKTAEAAILDNCPADLKAPADNTATRDKEAQAPAEQVRLSSSTTGIGIDVLAKKKITIQEGEVALDIRTTLKPVRNLMQPGSDTERNAESPLLEWGHPQSCNLRDPAVQKRCKAIVKEICCVRRFQGHMDCINCVVFDRLRVFTGSADHVVFLWDLRSGELVRQLLGHTGSVRCLQLDSKRSILYSGSWDESVIVWDVIKFKAVAQLLGHTGAVTCLRLNSEGTILVSASEDSTVRVWSTLTYKCKQLLTMFGSSAVQCLWFDSWLLAVGGEDGILRVYDSQTERLDRKYHMSPTLTTAANSMPPGGSTAATSDQPVMTSLETKAASLSAVLVIGDLAIAGTSTGELHCWDRLSGACVGVFAVHRSSVVALALCYGRLLTASSDGLVKEWELGTMSCIRVLRGHSSAIRSMEVREQDDRIVTVGEDKLVHVWDMSPLRTPNAARQRRQRDKEQRLQTWLPATGDSPT